jgi:exonuclease VII large subunit
MSDTHLDPIARHPDRDRDTTDRRYPPVRPGLGVRRALLALYCLCLPAAFPAAAAEPPAATPPVPSTSTWERLKREWADFLDALGDYTAEKHQATLQETRRLLERLDQQIDAARGNLEARWDSLSQETRERAARALAELERRRQELARWYAEMEQAGAEAWEETREAFEEAYEAAEDALDELMRDEPPPTPEPPTQPTPI